MHYIIILLAIPLFVYVAFKLFLKAPQFGRLATGQDLNKIMHSPNYIKGKFRNRTRVKDHMSFKKIPTLIKQNQEADKQKRPPKLLPISLEALYRQKQSRDDIQITWFGHSCILLETDGMRILIDPMLGNHASPVPGTVKRFSNMDIDWDRVEPVDLIVFSHDHYDHLDYGSFLKLKDKTDFIVGPLGIAAHLKYWGFASEKIHECDWGDSYQYKGVSLVSCPTKHFSGRTPTGRDQCLWCSWVIEVDGKKLYFSSDSGYSSNFEEIGQKHGPFDLAFMECGQYNHLWRENHMFPEESLQAFVDVKAKLMLPIHWGGFSLAPHDWREPVERLLAEAKKRNINDIIFPGLGAGIVLEKDYPKEMWWKK